MKWTVSLACAAVLALWAPAPAKAGNDQMPVYLGVEKAEGGLPLVKFVFTDLEEKAFTPRAAFTLVARDGKCEVKRVQDGGIAEQYRMAPLFDPAKPPEGITGAQLPHFFATIVMAEVARTGLAATEEQALPYGICTRKFWESILVPAQ